jgi:hypothetical protein
LQRWFGPVLEHGSRWCAPNLDTRCAFLRVGPHEFPVTVNQEEWENSWVCSPFTHYVSYAREEIRRAVHPALATPARRALHGVGHWLRRASFNRVVMVNNWLMSTNPWPLWDAVGLPAALEALRTRWPDHAFVFRSLNGRADEPLLRALASEGARLIPSRQIWLFDPGSEAVGRATNLKHDRRLLRRDDLEIVPHEGLNDTDFERLAGLYGELYLEKHSRHNPAYTSAWLRHLWSHGLLRFTALREWGGELVGVEARAVLHGTMVSPVVGYALSRPPSVGLYRRLAAIPVLAARNEGVPLNLSAGAGRFKALRGGEPVMEYIAVLDRHLPRRRRRPWRLIEGISRAVLAPVVRRKGL